TALLKVVDNRVYFTIDVETDIADNGLVTRTFESQVHTVPVGLVMSVTPQISPEEEITLNVRPTISRILRFVRDPNPALGDVENLIPEISVREIETILRVRSGDVAVIGGLMQDSRSKSTDGLPHLSKLPVIGDFFSYRDDKVSKSELVIFLKPIVAKLPTLEGKFASYKRFLNNSSKENVGAN
ncbi:MAG: type II and III secretion system protein, partial [Piscirickettsiaceae bacterium]